MYLSINSCHKLDILIKDFEVAYRSYVSDIILNNFPTHNDFNTHLRQLDSTIIPSSIINTSNNKRKLKTIISNTNEHFMAIVECHNSMINRSILTTVNVPFVSTIINYIELFFDPYFKQSALLSGFLINDFFDLSYKYHKIRNELSHPASSKIVSSEAKELIRFIEKVFLNINDRYFWFVSKSSLKLSIISFTDSINAIPIKIHNLSEIVYTHQKLVCRDSELKILRENIFGKVGFEYYRKSRSIVVYGYGGLGKTALVLEFINEIVKEAIDTSNKYSIDFILFFTAKDEVLSFSQTTGEFQINDIKKQFSSFEEFRTNLFKILSISTIAELANLKGIIIIDNIETLKEDKPLFNEFIKTSPESIQYIITSREEEDADNKMQIKGFENIENGKKFIKEYIDDYNLNIEYVDEYLELVTSSKGNTLILVLSLLRLNENPQSIKSIIGELNSTSSASISAVANFMYKNTFDLAITEITNQGYDSKKILSVIAYYNEPIDLYSLAKLTDIKNIPEVEKICDKLTRRLVLSKKNESYEINEFASKFIIVKIIPNQIEAQYLTNVISEYKFNRKKILRSLESSSNDEKLSAIMNDWVPRNNIEKIAIAEVFNLYSLVRQIETAHHKKPIIEKISDKFKEIESLTSHPYVKFQKARIYQSLLNKTFRQDYLNIITKSFEDSIFSIRFEYQYIAKTQSFGVVLWLYGMFLVNQFGEYVLAARYLDESKNIFENNGLKNDNYKKVLILLRKVYENLYRQTYDRAYKQQLEEINKLTAATSNKSRL